MAQRFFKFAVFAHPGFGVLPGLAALAGLALLGQWASRYAGLPGPVLGLALYVALMAAMPGFARATQAGAELLLKILGVLITPAAVGLALHRNELASELGRLVLVIVLSTVVTGVVTAYAYKALRRGGQSGKGAKP